MSEVVYNFTDSAVGQIDNKDPNALKVLGISLEFADIQSVSRRQVAYTCLKTSKEARRDATAKNLVRVLTEPITITTPLSTVITPVYRRGTDYLVPSLAVIEGLRDTAAKKRRFIETVVKTTPPTQGPKE